MTETRPAEVPLTLRSPSVSMTLFVLLTAAVAGMTFSIAVSSIAMGSAIVILLAVLWRSRGDSILRSPLDGWFLAYLIAETAATIFSVEPSASLVNMKRLFQISILYLSLATLTTERRLGVLIGSFVLLSVGLTLVELFSITEIGGHFPRISEFQYFLTEGGLKMFALLIVVPFAIHPSTPQRIRIAAAAATAVMLLGLVVTQTRSSWLGFIAGLVTMAAFRSKWVLVGIVALIILFLLFAPADYRNRGSSMFDPAMKSNLSRIHMIETGWRMFLDRPWTGTGDIDLKKLYITYIVPIDDAEGGHLHNNFMMLLVTLGAGGFIVVMGMFVKIFLVENSARAVTAGHWLFGSVTLGAQAAWVGFQVNGLFEWNFGDHEIAVAFWGTVGMALAARRLFESRTAIPEGT